VRFILEKMKIDKRMSMSVIITDPEDEEANSSMQNEYYNLTEQ